MDGTLNGTNKASVTSAGLAVDGSGVVQPVSGSVTAVQTTGSNLHVVVDTAPTTAITASSLPLPTGAATAAKQPALGTAGTPSTDVISVQGEASMTPLKVDGSGVTQPISGTVSISGTSPVSGTVTAVQSTGSNLHVVVDTAPTTAVTGTFFQATQPVSATSLPLPTGASTAAKQPALGTAGSASTDVITVQGVASMTPLKVDGSGVTQPISGTVSLSGTSPVSGTVTAIQGTGSNLHVVVDTAPTTAVTGTFFQATQPISATALPLPTGAATETTLAGIKTDTDKFTFTSTRLLVDGSGVTQPISGSVTTSGTSTVSGVAAQGASVSGNPLLDGAQGRDTLQTVVATGQVTAITADRYGRLYKVSPITSHATSNGTPITSATNTTLVAGPSANTHIRVHRIHASNSGVTGTWVYWRDGASGNKLYPTFLPTNGIVSLKLEGSLETTGGATPNALVMNTSAAGNVEWHVDYETVAD